jgi:hypothetical protein
MFACMGAAATYLSGEGDTAIEALLSAHDLLSVALGTDPVTGTVDKHKSSAALRRVPPVDKDENGDGDGDGEGLMISLDLSTIESNLVTALESARRFDECLAMSAVLFHVDACSLRGAHVVAFATVDWQSTAGLSERAIDDLEDRLAAKLSPQQLKLNLSTAATATMTATRGKHTLFAEIQSFQRAADGVVNHFIPCFLQSRRYRDMFLEASMALLQMVSSTEALRAFSTAAVSTVTTTGNGGGKSVPGREGLFPSTFSVAKLQQHIDTTDAGVTLVTQLFNPMVDRDKQDQYETKEVLEARRTLWEDMQVVLVRNLLNPYVQQVCLLLESDLDLSRLPNQHKIEKYLLGKRMTFRDAFRFADAHLKGRTVVVGEFTTATAAVRLH